MHILARSIALLIPAWLPWRSAIILSAGQWNDHSFTLGQDVTINGKFIAEAPVKSGRSGDMTLSVRPAVQGESVHH